MVIRKESREAADFVRNLQAANKIVTNDQALLVYGALDAARILLRVPKGKRITINRSK